MKYFKLLILLFLLIFFYGCKQIQKPDWALSLDNFDYCLNLGEEIVLDVNINDYYKDQIIVFSSNNETIAIVVDGVLKTKGVGETEIRISLQDYPECFIDIAVIVTNWEADIPKQVIEWVKTEIGSDMLMPGFFPVKHPEYDVEIEYESDNPEVLTNEGMIFQGKFDIEVGLKITVRYKDYIATEVHNIVVAGYAFVAIYNNFFNQLPPHRKIIRDYDIKIENLNDSYPDANISWRSTNQSVFTDKGIYHQPFDDTPFLIVLTISFPDQGASREFAVEYLATGVSIYEKAQIVKGWLEKQNIITDILTSDIELPLYYNDEFEAVLEWSSNKPEIIAFDGKITPSNKNELVVLTCKVTTGGANSFIKFNTEIPAKMYEDKWEAIEAFLDVIFIDKIETQKYTIAGVGPSYTAYNYGYIPFYFNEKSNVTVDLLPEDHLMRPSPGENLERKYVVIHDTANNKPGSGAEMHNRFIKNPDRQKSSWHYTVDDELIFQHIPDREIAWHAGNEEGNYYGIGIETCINPEVNYTVVMQKTAKLTAELLNRYGLTLHDIKQHYDFTGKECPRVMRTNSRWDEFIDLVSIEYLGVTNFSDVQFIWESLSKNIMDDTGRVFNHPGIETNVSFKVTVTYNNETKEYTHTSALLPPRWS